MNKLSFIMRFLYRIRYWLLILPILVTILVTYFTSNLPKTYEAVSTIFTGISSSPKLEGDKTDFFVTNSSFDNIINLVRSRSTLEKVSIKLLAQHLVYGDPESDNKYITSANYINLRNIVPSDVFKLVDKSSVAKTYNNLTNYRRDNRENFIYSILNWSHPHYSISSLSSKIQVKRLGNSDMIEIKYTCDDPGIVHNTLMILDSVVIQEYTDLQLGSSNDVIKYFEDQLIDIRKQLTIQEDSLLIYSKGKVVINFEEQTKKMTEDKKDIYDRYEQARIDYYTSRHLISNLEQQLDKRAGLIMENKQFIQTLKTVSGLSKKITELETFTDESSGTGKNSIAKYKEMLKKSEKDLFEISSKITALTMSKEGASMDDVIKEWLTQKLIYEKAVSDLDLLEERKNIIDQEFLDYAPVGPNLKKLEREITVRENSYQTILNHLAQARLQQKDIEMRRSTLQIVTPAIYPLGALASKRKIFVIAAFIGCFIFIVCCFLIIELLDKTVRDKFRGNKLTDTTVLSAIPGASKLKHRGFALEIKRKSIGFLCNRILQNITDKRPVIINIISSESGEGKTFVAEGILEHFEEMNFKVKYISHNKDFNYLSKDYILSGKDSFCSYIDGEYEIIIIEYPPLNVSALPKCAFENGSINLYLVRATRAWKDLDQILLDQVKEVSEAKTFVIINKAERIAVEDFTGQLPPFTKYRKLQYKLLQFELTSDKK